MTLEENAFTLEEANAFMGLRIMRARMQAQDFNFHEPAATSLKVSPAGNSRAAVQFDSGMSCLSRCRCPRMHCNTGWLICWPGRWSMTPSSLRATCTCPVLL